jgi:hypothetical protein
MAVKYSKRPLNISTFSNLRTSEIYPKNWDFCFENILSGNPENNSFIFAEKQKNI